MFFANHKKLIISICLAVVLFVGGLLGFVIIPNAVNQFRPANGGPTAIESVSGNGGAAVMVGEYLYFTSGYISSADVKYKQNEYNKVKDEGAIYRVKMADGAPEYDNSYLADLIDDWDEMEYDDQLAEYGDIMNKRVVKSDLRLIVPKIAGWEKTAIWVYGNTLVYTTPNNQKDKHGQLQRDRIDFFRVNLDGSKHKKIYTTTSTSVATTDFTVAHVDGTTYLLCKDGEKLVRVGMDGKTNTFSETAQSFGMPRVSSYYAGIQFDTETDTRYNLANNFSGLMKYVYYTEKCEIDQDDDEDTVCAWRGNVLMRYDIATGEKTTLRHDHGTHTVLALGNGALVFQTAFENVTEKALYVVNSEIAVERYKDTTYLDANHRMAQDLQTEEKLYISGERSLANSFIFVTHANSTLFVYNPTESKSNSNYQPTQIPVNDVASVIEVTPSNILYTTSSGTLKCIDYAGQVKTGDEAGAPESAVDGARVTAFRVLNSQGGSNGTGYMFFYVKTINQQDHDGEDVITVGAVIDAQGNEYLLTILEDKFIHLPDHED